MKRIAALSVLLSLLLSISLAHAQKKAPETPVKPAQKEQLTKAGGDAAPPSNPSEKKEKAFADGKSTSLFDLFRKGGPFMWPILILAAIGMGFIIERFLHFRKARLNPQELIAELEKTLEEGTLADVEKICAGRHQLFSRIILKGLKMRTLGYEQVEKAISISASIEVAILEKGLNIISAAGNLAPLLGFLGTVSGMITAFSNIAAADQVNARLVAGGIEEALITTAAGLIVAIPLLAFYNYFVHRIEVFTAEVERVSADILEKMVESRAQD